MLFTLANDSRVDHILCRDNRRNIKLIKAPTAKVALDSIPSDCPGIFSVSTLTNHQLLYHQFLPSIVHQNTCVVTYKNVHKVRFHDEIYHRTGHFAVEIFCGFTI